MTSNTSPRIQNVSAGALGAATNNYGVRNDHSTATLINVVAFAKDGSVVNFAVRSASSAPTMANVVATANGGQTSRGVYLSDSAGTVVNGVGLASGGSNTNHGLHVVDGGPQIDSSSFTGTGAAGIQNQSGGSRITNTRIVGGVSNDDPATNCRDHYDENLANVTC